MRREQAREMGRNAGLILVGMGVCLIFTPFIKMITVIAIAVTGGM